jgi:prepilin-type N-terminal cleavage/methylation domain-containing protein
MKRSVQGFTLIEIAIVLVIIGLLLGGVLKGQELITGARVRNLISQQDGIKAAFFGFQDRYRALPGDYAAADQNINCTGGCPSGNGNGRVEDAAGSKEYIFTWTHLTAAGFLNGSYTANSGTTTVSQDTTPKNPYSVFIELAYDKQYGDPTASATTPDKHNLKTGPQVPVEIVAEVDRKIDDGRPYFGSFQFSNYIDSGTGPLTSNCILNGNWKSSGSTDCGGASLF